MKNFIAQSMKRFGLNKPVPQSPNQDDKGANHTDPLAHLKIGSKWSYSTLEYPQDIQSRSDLGHYMMFYINIANSSRSKYSRTGGAGAERQKHKLTAHDKRKGNVANWKTESGANSQETMIMNRQGHAKDANAQGKYDTSGGSWEPGQSERIIERKSIQGVTSKQVEQTDRTGRTTDSIVM